MASNTIVELPLISAGMGADCRSQPPGFNRNGDFGAGTRRVAPLPATSEPPSCGDTIGSSDGERRQSWTARSLFDERRLLNVEA